MPRCSHVAVVVVCSPSTTSTPLSRRVTRKRLQYYLPVDQQLPIVRVLPTTHARHHAAQVRAGPCERDACGQDRVARQLTSLRVCSNASMSACQRGGGGRSGGTLHRACPLRAFKLCSAACVGCKKRHMLTLQRCRDCAGMFGGSRSKSSGGGTLLACGHALRACIVTCL